MARPAKIEDGELLQKLSAVFREVGYEGASLTLLSEATGLKKASLYHRFPDGKQQMAYEVLAAAEKWLSEQVISPLKGPGTPSERVKKMTKKLYEFYSGGRQACLLNMLSSAHIHEGPFTPSIKRMFESWITALGDVLVESGMDRRAARARAERAIALLQGTLVLSRGMGTTKPFRDGLSRFNEELFNGDRR